MRYALACMMTFATTARMFVYYRVPLAQTCAVADAVRQMQAALLSDWPGLRVQLLRRADAHTSEANHLAASEETWMEIYEHPLGLSDRVLQAIDACAKALPTGLAGERHVEIFVPLAMPDA
jgi:hypothetical protein